MSTYNGGEFCKKTAEPIEMAFALWADITMHYATDGMCDIRLTDGRVGLANCPASVHLPGAINRPGAPSVVSLIDNT